MNDILEALEQIYEDGKIDLMTEAEYNKFKDHLHLEIMDVDLFVKRNNIRPVTNPIFFKSEGFPTEDGLLSNDIFGITKETRAGTYAYIDLGGVFLDPSCYKAWSRLDSKVKACIHGTDTFSINSKGELVSDPNGKNGAKFLKDNFDSIKIRTTESRKRDSKIEYIKANKDRMFITKYIVIPAYYRDVNSGRNVGVGEINRLYSQLLVAVKGYKEVTEYGVSSGMMGGRIQELILAIYDWFSGNNNNIIKESGTGLAGKTGVLRRSNLSKTADYSARLVITAPDMKVETVDDLKVDTFHSSLPLAAAMTNFYPYILYNINKFFTNNFGGVSTVEAIDPKTGNITRLTPKDPLIEFSDERIKDEIKKYIYSYSGRITPIPIHVEEDNKVHYMVFKGTVQTKNKGELVESISQRRLCWIDVFYQAAVEATKDKCILITRFPIDSFYSQFPSEIVVSSTKETEDMIINNTHYKYYPKIREEDINSDTSNIFVDTLSMSNLHLKSIGGDYDGDQVTSKGSYYIETNEEQKDYLHSKAFFIDAGGTNIRMPDGEAIQSLYSLTKVIEGTKLTNPTF